MRFPLFEISKRCINSKLRGETEEKLRGINEEIERIEQDIMSANRAIILSFVNEIKENFEELKFSVNRDGYDEQTIEKIIEACDKIEENASELKLLVRTYLVE